MPPGNDRQAFEATSEIALPPVAIPVPELRPETMLGQYQLLERIGAGGMGEVFKAVHPTMQRVVAVKIMAPTLVQDARARARFRREVQSAARLAHPNIVMAFDAAEEAGRCFLVMEYVEGRDAAALVAEFGPPPIAVACDVIGQAALALQHAHEQGMVHRDVKPANLMIAARRPPGRLAPPGWPAEPLVKILDFGLARFQAGDSDAGHVAGSTPLTREGHVVGTPEYMAPEQARNSGLTDIRSDIYSLGCTFYCLLTGRPPFVAPSLLEVMVQHLQSQPPPVSHSRPDVPDAIVAVLGRMLAKRPEERYHQPAEVAAALRPFVAAPASPVAVVAAGPPVHVFAETRPDGIPQVPTARPTPAPEPTVLTAPGPGVVTRAVTATARALLGCLALFLLLIASMIAGWVYLLRADNGEQSGGVAESSKPLAGIDLVPFPADRLTPSYAPQPIDILSGFALSDREVTCGQFRAFVTAARYKTDAEKGAGVSGRGAVVLTGDGKGGWQESAAWDRWRPNPPDDTPVACVSWEDALRFCNWLSEREHLQPCYRMRGGSAAWDCDFLATGYRLPAEAEWEYAARASRTTLLPEPRGELLRHGWFRENADGQPHAVGSAPGRTPHGVADVWGNVWEWCWDLHTPPSGTERVVRGGSWCDPAPTTAAETRKAFAPDYRANYLGFRVARTTPRQ